MCSNVMFSQWFGLGDIVGFSAFEEVSGSLITKVLKATAHCKTSRIGIFARAVNGTMTRKLQQFWDVFDLLFYMILLVSIKTPFRSAMPDLRQGYEEDEWRVLYNILETVVYRHVQVRYGNCKEPDRVGYFTIMRRYLFTSFHPCHPFL